jgi:hypothetical protein
MPDAASSYCFPSRCVKSLSITLCKETVVIASSLGGFHDL